MGLYERLLEEAAREERPPDPDTEKYKRIAAYTSSLRKTIPEGGYVTSEELQEQQEKYLREISMLKNFIIHGVSDSASGYAFGALRSKYPAEYATLRRIWGWGRR
jgi:hypothetical protein